MRCARVHVILGGVIVVFAAADIVMGAGPAAVNALACVVGVIHLLRGLK